MPSDCGELVPVMRWPLSDSTGGYSIAASAAGLDVEAARPALSRSRPDS